MALLVAAPLMAYGQDRPAPDSVHVLYLDHLLAEVDANNPSLRAARLNAEALGTRSAQVSALPDPSAMLTYQPVPVVTARGWQRTQWRVEQAIPYPGKRALRGTIADLSADVAGYEAETFAQDLKLQLKEMYFDLYRIQVQDTLIAVFQAQLGDFEEVAATRYEVGVGSQQAVLKAQVERNRLAIRREQLAAERRATLEGLARLLNRPDLTGLPDEAVVVERVVDIATDTLLTAALTLRPEARALRVAGERAAWQVALARREFWPDFMVSATFFDIAHTDVPPSADGRDAVALGVGVKVPLWRAKLRANLEEAQVRQQQVDARLDALETTFRTQLQNLASQLDRQQRQLTLFRQTLIPQAETTLESTLSAYNTGTATFLDLLDAERTLFTLRLDEAATTTRYLQTLAALERALGVASIEDL